MAMAKEERERAARGEGPLGKAADDEPVFILRAQDEVAAGRVADWADFAEARGVSSAKVAEARDIAEQMRNYPNRKLPD